jgi:hypothetical protein
MLLGEERDLGSRSASFFCLDRRSGKALWKNASFGEAWWIGIEAVADGVLLLHLFATPELPVHHGIIAVDLENGGILWSTKELTFTSVLGLQLYASKRGMSGDVLVEVELKTGAILRELRDSNLPGEVGPVNHGIQYSIPLDRQSGSLASETLRRSPRQMNAVGPVEVVEGSRFTAFSHLEKTGPQTADQPNLVNTVFVVESSDGREVFSDTLRTDVQTESPEQIFVWDSFLYYIKQRRELKAVRLPE